MFKLIQKWCLLLVFACQPAAASFSIAGDGQLSGTFSSQYGLPLTIACFGKYATHTANLYTIYFAEGAANQPGLGIQTGSADDRHQIRSDGTDADGVPFINGSAAQFDGVWFGIVGKFTSTASRDVYVNTLANTANNATTSTVGTALDAIFVGQAANAGSDWVGFVAECAIWDVALSDANITSYLGGECAANIDPTNLIGYWPMDTTGSTQANEGLDAGGDLTLGGANAFDADHPTITCDAGTTSVQRRRNIQ